jgi:uncharacterized membrane protein YhaH (DUF805 family)
MDLVQVMTSIFVIVIMYVLPIRFMSKRVDDKSKYVWALVIIFIPIYGFLSFLVYRYIICQKEKRRIFPVTNY